MSKMSKAFSHREISYSRTLQAKIGNRWVEVANFILNKHTTEGRKHYTHMLDWPEVQAIIADYPEGTKFKFGATYAEAWVEYYRKQGAHAYADEMVSLGYPEH